MHARPRLGARRQVGLLSPADELWDVTAGVGPLAIRAAKVGCRVRPPEREIIRSAAQRSGRYTPSRWKRHACETNEQAEVQVGMGRKWEWLSGNGP